MVCLELRGSKNETPTSCYGLDVLCVGWAGAEAQLEMLPTQSAWLETPASPALTIGESARSLCQRGSNQTLLPFIKDGPSGEDRQQAPEDDVSIMKSLGGTAETECALALDRGVG